MPLVTDLTDDAEFRKLLEIQFTAFELGRPYFVADGVPADRVAALRAAFDKVMLDKDLRVDAKKQDLEVLPMTGQEMQKILAEVYATPKAQIERLKEATKVKARPEGAGRQRGRREEEHRTLAASRVPTKWPGSPGHFGSAICHRLALCATRGGVPGGVGPARVIMLSSRSRSCSNEASSGPSSTRPRGSRMRIGSTWRPLTMIS